MDRNRSYANIRTALTTSALAILIFGLAFYVAVLYLT